MTDIRDRDALADDAQPEIAPDVVRRVVLNQLLWTAGSTLVTGGFLLYFARELGTVAGYDRGTMAIVTACLLAIPETVGVAALLGRAIVRIVGSRKRVYIGCSIAARIVSVGIPLLAFPGLRPEGLNPLWVMIALLAVVEALQAVAYVAYLSWIADLAPEERWGRFFAIRNVAKMVALLFVPTTAGFLRDTWRHGVPSWITTRLGIVDPPEWWTAGLSNHASLVAYVVAFGVGIGLLVLSILPMVRLPEVPLADEALPRTDWQRAGEAFRDPSMRYLLVHQWWLAAANGLTQVAFFEFLFRHLGFGLGPFYLLFVVMRLVKLPVSVWAGGWCDAGEAKPTLVGSLLIASGALGLWLAATPERWWLVFGAYALWGTYAAANLAGRQLTLELAPRGDNTTHLALFRHIGGLCAGLSGLAGGFWLHHLQAIEFSTTLAGYEIDPYRLLFAVSLAGRMTAVVWLIPVHGRHAAS